LESLGERKTTDVVCHQAIKDLTTLHHYNTRTSQKYGFFLY
jgi:hypothetical protein